MYGQKTRDNWKIVVTLHTSVPTHLSKKGQSPYRLSWMFLGQLPSLIGIDELSPVDFTFLY